MPLGSLTKHITLHKALLLPNFKIEAKTIFFIPFSVCSIYLIWKLTKMKRQCKT